MAKPTYNKLNLLTYDGVVSHPPELIKATLILGTFITISTQLSATNTSFFIGLFSGSIIAIINYIHNHINSRLELQKIK